MRIPTLLLPFAAMILMCVSAAAFAVETPMTLAFDLPSTDVAVAGVGGIGERGPPGLGGAGVIALGGVNGSVQKAWLYWHGIDLERVQYGFVGGNFDYDEAAIEFEGNNITGTRIAGMGDNNCWGNDTSPNRETAALYRADVTALVQAHGNGDYVFSGLSDGGGHSASGLSLIVYFDDGNPDNNLHVRHFEGLKSNWNTTFKVYYQGGPVEAILHVVDGQAVYAQNATRWEALPNYPGGGGSNTTIYQDVHNGERLWAGLSVPDMLRPRPPNGNGLWDIQRLSFSGVFGPMRDYDVTVRGGGTAPTDCYSLMVMQVLEPVSRKALQLEPAWHDFGNVPAQTTSAAQVFTVTNWMDLPISFPGPPQVLSNPSLFPISANQCTGQTLQPGGQCSFSVSCAPPAIIGSTQNNTVLMTWRAEFSPVFTGRAYSTVDCSIYMPPNVPSLLIDPAEFHFGSTAPNGYSPPHDFIVRNNGNVALTMQNVLGFDRGFELVSNTCTNGLVLAPAAECLIQVRFRAEGSPGSTRATNLFVIYGHAQNGYDRTASKLYAITAGAQSDTIFVDGFE